MASEDILVTIPQGTLRGKKEESVSGDIFYSFQGIPYGKAQRFRAPQPADGWTGIRDATKAGKSSPTLDLFSPGGPKLSEQSSEDCLFLNVYTREMPKPGKKYPVMVNIHGGGYTVGDGSKNSSSPDYFMVHDVVIVSINYRLGVFGFLSLQSTDCPGNYGLKDQRLALRWVQENISKFGGNPDNVTIFGISAGGSSVHNLTLSPSCKGLFKKAIAQSGASTNSWGYSVHPRECAYLLGKKLGCDAGSDEELLEFLRKAPVDALIVNSFGVWPEVEGKRIGEQMLNFPFTPTPEPESEEAILSSAPMTRGNQLDVPYITGVTDKEMLMEVNDPDKIPKWTDIKDFQQLVPRELNIPKDSELSLKIAQKIRDFFFNGKEVNKDSLIDALSDLHFVHGVYRAIKHRLTNSKIKSPTYVYLFSYNGKVNFIKTAMEKLFGAKFADDEKGALHGSDTPYLFVCGLPGPFPDYKVKVEPGSQDFEVMRKFVKMWVNFATTGEPTNEDFEVKWSAFDADSGTYLEINEELKLKKGFFKERMEFWDEIYKLAGKEPYANAE